MQAFSNELNHAMTAQVTYVGTRGLRLYRFVGINQAQIATLTRPVTNAVTGDVITTNAPDDAAASTHARSVDSRILRPESDRCAIDISFTSGLNSQKHVARTAVPSGVHIL